MKIEDKVLRNYAEFPAPKSALSSVQISKTLHIVFCILDEIGNNSRRGSFIMASQKTNPLDELQRIVEFDLSSGKCNNYLDTGRDSAIAAWDAITTSSQSGRIPDGESAIIHLSDSPIFLSLNATGGRFLAAFFANGADYRAQASVYIAIGKALSLYYTADEILQESYRATLEKEARHYSHLNRISERVNVLFHS